MSRMEGTEMTPTGILHLFCTWAFGDSGERNLFGSSVGAIVGLRQLASERSMWRAGDDTIERSQALVMAVISLFYLCGPGDEFLLPIMSSTVVSLLRHHKKRLNVAA